MATADLSRILTAGLIGILTGLLIPRNDDRFNAVKDDVDLGVIGATAKTTPEQLKAKLPTTDKVDFETSCNTQLSLLEREPGYFSTIDEKKKLRIFNFPDFEIGDDG